MKLLAASKNPTAEKATDLTHREDCRSILGVPPEPDSVQRPVGPIRTSGVRRPEVDVLVDGQPGLDRVLAKHDVDLAHVLCSAPGRPGSNDVGYRKPQVKSNKQPQEKKLEDVDDGTPQAEARSRVSMLKT
jgi:hypothetical protein